jgi:single-stranded DNA-binding protein
MSAFALISGALFRAPELKTSKAGKPYVVATMKVAADKTADFWHIVAFSDSTQAELLRLGEGDKIAVQGALKIETYTGKDGQARISRSVTADNVLALRQPPKEREPKTERANPCDEAPAPSRAFYDDEIPF